MYQLTRSKAMCPFHKVNRFLFYSTFLVLLGGTRKSLILWNTPVNRKIPVKTNAVPNQWYTVKGLRKYKMEKTKLKNFLSVTMRVTMRDGHSVVKMKTPRMQTYVKKHLVKEDALDLDYTPQLSPLKITTHSPLEFNPQELTPFICLTFLLAACVSTFGNIVKDQSSH